MSWTNKYTDNLIKSESTKTLTVPDTYTHTHTHAHTHTYLFSGVVREISHPNRPLYDGAINVISSNKLEFAATIPGKQIQIVSK